MPGEVITFPVKPKPSGVLCPVLGFRFPTVYRVSGYYHGATERDGELYLTDERGERAPFSYTLSDQDSCGLRDCKWVEVAALDATLDTVSLVIRHHHNEELAHGYMNALCDFILDDGESSQFTHESGLFTIAQIPTKETWPGPLLIFFADHWIDTDMFSGWNIWSHIVGAAGAILDDAVLYPEE